MTTTKPTLRQALKSIRAEYATATCVSNEGRYDCDAGTLIVGHRKSVDGSRLLGLFQAKLVGPDGATIKTYDV